MLRNRQPLLPPQPDTQPKVGVSVQVRTNLRRQPQYPVEVNYSHWARPIVAYTPTVQPTALLTEITANGVAAISVNGVNATMRARGSLNSTGPISFLLRAKNNRVSTADSFPMMFGSAQCFVATEFFSGGGDLVYIRREKSTQSFQKVSVQNAFTNNGVYRNIFITSPNADDHTATQIFIDATEVGYASTASRNGSGTVTSIASSVNILSSSYVGGLLFGFMFARVFSAEERAELVRNPWQIFRPTRNLAFYSLPASGSTVSDSITEGAATSDAFTSQADLNAAFSDTNSVSEEVIAAASTLAQLQESSVVADSVFASGGQNPTLSAATIFNVQATQATPRVTLTF